VLLGRQVFDLKPLGGQAWVVSAAVTEHCSHALAGQFDAVCIMNEAFENGVGDRRTMLTKQMDYRYPATVVA